MGSRTRTMGGVAAGAVAAVLLLAGCGDDGDDRSDDEQEVIDALVEEGATEDEAACFVDAVGADRVEQFMGAAEDDVPAEDQAEALEALDECGVDLGG